MKKLLRPHGIGRRALAVLLGAAVLVPSGIVTSRLKASAAYFEVGDTGTALYVNVGQPIALRDIALTLGGKSLKGSDLTWIPADSNVTVRDGILTDTAKGISTVGVTDGTSSRSIDVVAKDAAESEFVLYQDDFSAYADGTLPAGWSVAANGDVSADVTDGPHVSGGKMIVGNGVANAATIALLPSYLNTFSDYQVDMEFANTNVWNNLRYGALILRAQTADAGGTVTFSDGYNTLFRRAATAAGGMEIYTTGDSVKNAAGGYPNNLGATYGTGWQSLGYNMHLTSSVQGESVRMFLYRLPDQPNAAGDDAAYVPADQLTDPSWSADITGFKKQFTAGGVGVRAVGFRFEISNIKVSVPVSMVSDPSLYTMSADPGAGGNTTYQPLKVGIISDVHLYDSATGADDNLKKMLTLYKDRGADAIMIAGDVGNTGTTAQYDKFNSIWDSVFPDPAAAPKRLIIMGNHDYESVIDSEHYTVEQAQQRFAAAFGSDLNFNVVIDGYHFIGMSGEGSAVNGTFTSTTVNWLKQQLDAAVAENPNMPVFVMAHQPVSGTTYGSDWGGNPAFADLLKNYPQVVYFAGHAHYPLENERCIYQKDFTAVDIPSLQYTSVETGTADQAFASQEALWMEIKTGTKQIDLERLKVQTMGPIKNDWILDLPLNTATFSYTDARKDSRVAPSFASDAKITVSDITSNSCTVRFPSATDPDYVQGYTVKVIDKASGTVYSQKYYVSDFYVDINNMAKTQSVDLKGLLADTAYTIQITAKESFGLESQPIACDVQTFANNTASDGVPRADILDVDFHVGFMDNSPYRAPYTLYSDGFHPAIVTDEAFGRNVLRILPSERWVNYPTNPTQIAGIQNTVTLETAFKAADLNGTHCVMANMQSGGIGFEMDNGLMEVWMDFADGYKHIGFQVTDTERYYHVVATYDGAALKLYVDGQLAGQTEAAGAIVYNPDMDIFTIGANPVVGGNAANVFTGDIALARVYSSPLSADDVQKAYAHFLNDPMYVAVYKNTTILKNLDIHNSNYFISAGTLNAISRLIKQGDQIDDDADVTQEQANQFVADSNAVIAEFFAEAGVPNPNTPTPTTTTGGGETTGVSTTDTTAPTESSAPTATTDTSAPGSSTSATATSVSETEAASTSATEPLPTTEPMDSRTSVPPSTVSSSAVSVPSTTSGTVSAPADSTTAAPAETAAETAVDSPLTGSGGAGMPVLLVLAAGAGTVLLMKRRRFG